MDNGIRELERQISAEPDNIALREALVRAWNRAGVIPSNASNCALIQKEWETRYQALEDELSQKGRARFIKYLECVFAENPGLELITFISYVPGFMDGDPLRLAWSILVSPRSFASHGIYPYEDIYEDYSWQKDKADQLTLRPGVINGELSSDACEVISNQIWSFTKVMYNMFGTNTRVNFTRDTEREKEDHWLPKGVTWQRDAYEAGY